MLVGNGGGYGYGVMGATHHALEDYGALLCLPHLRAYVPAFDADVKRHDRSTCSRSSHPSYLRLGLSEEPKDVAVPPYAPWRRLQDGRGWVILVTARWPEASGGPSEARQAGRPSLWLLCELPVGPLPEEFLADLARSGAFSSSRSMSPTAASAQRSPAPLLASGQAPERFASRSALGYLSGLYGSQKFHRRECGLDPASIVHFLDNRGQLAMPEPLEAPIHAGRKIRRLQGPILVLGASGFVGANLMRTILAVRADVHGTTTRTPAWRLEGLPGRPRQHRRSPDRFQPRRPARRDPATHHLQLRRLRRLLVRDRQPAHLPHQLPLRHPLAAPAGVAVDCLLCPCGQFVGIRRQRGRPSRAGSDRTQQRLRRLQGRRGQPDLLLRQAKKFPCANLRLYSVYGPLEDSSRLIPNVIRRGLDGHYPEFVNPAVSRDFVYVDDVTEAFVDTALNLTPADYGESFNIGTGRKTTIGDVAATARELFGIAGGAGLHDARARLGRRRLVRQHRQCPPAPGLGASHHVRGGPAQDHRLVPVDCPTSVSYEQSSKQFGLDTVYSVTAIVACYKDNLAIPIMYERLKATFTKLNVDFEIIFVNDCSPDDTEEVIRRISRDDRRVIGISHSRNFGSQSAFRSGMEIASKNACVLLDGDLQDPPD